MEAGDASQPITRSAEYEQVKFTSWLTCHCLYCKWVRNTLPLVTGVPIKTQLIIYSSAQSPPNSFSDLYNYVVPQGD